MTSPRAASGPRQRHRHAQIGRFVKRDSSGCIGLAARGLWPCRRGFFRVFCGGSRHEVPRKHCDSEQMICAFSAKNEFFNQQNLHIVTFCRKTSPALRAREKAGIQRISAFSRTFYMRFFPARARALLILSERSTGPSGRRSGSPPGAIPTPD